jgi:hypothetical protein
MILYITLVDDTILFSLSEMRGQAINDSEGNFCAFILTNSQNMDMKAMLDSQNIMANVLEQELEQYTFQMYLYEL